MSGHEYDDQEQGTDFGADAGGDVGGADVNYEATQEPVTEAPAKKKASLLILILVGTVIVGFGAYKIADMYGLMGNPHQPEVAAMQQVQSLPPQNVVPVAAPDQVAMAQPGVTTVPPEVAAIAVAPDQQAPAPGVAPAPGAIASAGPTPAPTPAADTKKIEELETKVAELEAKLEACNNKPAPAVVEHKARRPARTAPIVHAGTKSPKGKVAVVASIGVDKPAAAATASAPDDKPMATETQVFTLVAVVPGRAWLKDGSGTRYTVSIGDTVQGLGKIKQIDADQGEVSTTDGKVVKGQ